MTGWATVVATLCHISGVPICVEEIVVESKTQQVTVIQCKMLGQVGIADWMQHHPTYHAGWRLKDYKCADGEYVLPKDI